MHVFHGKCHLLARRDVALRRRRHLAQHALRRRPRRLAKAQVDGQQQQHAQCAEEPAAAPRRVHAAHQLAHHRAQVAWCGWFG